MALFQRKSRDYMAMPVQKPRARSDDLVIEEVDEELLVYDSTNKRGHCLGATAARVWRACDGHSDVSAISEALELDAELVRQALDELAALELLDTQGLNVVQAGNGDGLTRRQLAKRSATVGAGIAAAPLVYSINVSPAMALATVIPFQCQIFTTQDCGSAAGCGTIDGCCCCCQGGGECKTCGATAFCNEETPGACAPQQGQDPPFSENCSSIGKKFPADPRGCCGLAGAVQCGCGFGPFAGCCDQTTGDDCAPGSSADCFPCCNDEVLESTSQLGCCRSATVNCCDPANVGLECCVKSSPCSPAADCCGPNPPPCCATAEGCNTCP